MKKEIRFKVVFTFLNSQGEWVTDYLNNNNEGFDYETAADLEYELRARGHRNVRIEEL